MKRASVFLLVGTAFAIGGMAFAHPHDKGESVRTIAEGTPVNRIVELAGPEPLPMDETVRRFLTAKGDSRPVLADSEARNFGLN